MKRLAVIGFAFLLAACPAGDPEWSVLRDGDDLDRVVLSAWGDGNETFFAGGGLGNGVASLALKWDGSSFTELATGAPETFWWVWGSAADNVYFVGEEGAVYQNTTKLSAPTSLTLYGVWGSSSSDIWVVGGDPLAATPTWVILHYDGVGTWTDYTSMVQGAVEGALFKVWGVSADAVWASGEGGTILRWDGTTWKAETSGSTAPLFTVHGSSATDVWAVGGPQATILRSNGDGTWRREDPGVPASVFNGVSVSPTGDAVVVGMNGVKLRYTGGQWFDDTFEPPPIDLHAAFIEPNGDAFAVGGNFFAPGTPTTIRVGVISKYE